MSVVLVWGVRPPGMMTINIGVKPVKTSLTLMDWAMD